MRPCNLLDEIFPRTPFSLCVPPPKFWRKPGLTFLPGCTQPRVLPCTRYLRIIINSVYDRTLSSNEYTLHVPFPYKHNIKKETPLDLLLAFPSHLNGLGERKFRPLRIKLGLERRCRQGQRDNLVTKKTRQNKTKKRGVQESASM